ncbi:uncharacterized protein EKO05_0010601 [Ascochyta rabiei]|uniref:uncharacterized protein n=1 Tax=Didymella rabiei TaxID=5454 RepID=UPI00220C57F5|nr:uncharacterized protein EKO05_0010601 [Ascochyta rabiei]UPX20367.1 hypothetical protein EKO05_0010601 [Ascochyta rabiei]
MLGVNVNVLGRQRALGKPVSVRVQRALSRTRPLMPCSAFRRKLARLVMALWVRG